MTVLHKRSDAVLMCMCVCVCVCVRTCVCACTRQCDAVNDRGDQSLPAGSTQSFSCFCVRQKTICKHLLVSQSAVQSKHTHKHTREVNSNTC